MQPNVTRFKLQINQLIYRFHWIDGSANDTGIELVDAQLIAKFSKQLIFGHAALTQKVGKLLIRKVAIFIFKNSLFTQQTIDGVIRDSHAKLTRLLLKQRAINQSSKHLLMQYIFI